MRQIKYLCVLLMILFVACSNAPEDYADLNAIKEDFSQLHKAKQSGDDGAVLKISQRLLSSKMDIGAARIPALISSGEVLARQGRIQEVKDLFDEQFPFVVKSKGGCSQAVYASMRAGVWKEVGRLDLAVTDYRFAIEKCPKLDNAYSRLSLIYSTSSDPQYVDSEKALELAQKAVEIRRSSKSLNAISYAYAKTGKFDLAVSYMEEAIKAGEKERRSQQEMAAFRTALSNFKSKADK